MKPYYEDGAVTIYHGDCRELLPRFRTDEMVVITDPPYGVEAVGKDGKTGGEGLAPNRVYMPVHGDAEPLDPTWLLRYGKRQIIWGADHFTVWPGLGRLLVWDKRDGLASNHHADVEIAWDSKRGPSRQYRHRQMGMLHDGYGDDYGRVHPTQKPVALMRWCVGMTGGVVIDPFMGSGSTLRAAKDLGRRSIGIEIEESYCEMAAKRCAQEVLGLSA